MVNTINSQPDLDFANNWLNKSRGYNKILTKPNYTRQLEQKIKDLEAGKGKKFKELEIN